MQGLQLVDQHLKKYIKKTQILIYDVAEYVWFLCDYINFFLKAFWDFFISIFSWTYPGNQK